MKDAQNQTSNLLAYYNQPYVKVVSQIIGYLAELVDRRVEYLKSYSSAAKKAVKMCLQL